PLRPLDRLAMGSGGGAQEQQKLDFKVIKSIEDLQREVATASANGQPVMFDLYADWCVSCKEMEKYTFSDPQVQAELAGVLLLKADVTANDATDQALLRHFEIFGPPTIAFFGSDGVERRDHRLVGFVNATRFRDHIRSAFTG